MVGSFKVETHRSQYCILSPQGPRQSEQRCTKEQGHSPCWTSTCWGHSHRHHHPLQEFTTTNHSHKVVAQLPCASLCTQLATSPPGSERHPPENRPTNAQGRRRHSVVSSLLTTPLGAKPKRACHRVGLRGGTQRRCWDGMALAVRWGGVGDVRCPGRHISLGLQGYGGVARLLLTRTSPPRPGYSNFHSQLAATRALRPGTQLSCFPLSIWPPSDDIIA